MGAQSIITIGNFDGVHRGHAALLWRARQLANERGLPVKAISFDPHPAHVLASNRAPKRLMLPHEKIAALRNAGADDVQLIKPTAAFLALEPQAFAQQLVEEHKPAAIIEGPDFQFGRNRSGTVDTLRELGKQLGYETQIVEPVVVSLSDQLLAPVRSSLVRWLITQGRVLDACRCLGRPYELSATVVTGEQRGRTIGVPTANLCNSDLHDKIMPLHGVYAGVAYVHGSKTDTEHAGQLFPAAISIGMKPTFGQMQLTIEAHLLEYDGDLYGCTISVRFLRWIRQQQKFAGLDQLVAQIRRDVARTRTWHEQGLLTADMMEDAIAQP